MGHCASGKFEQQVGYLLLYSHLLWSVSTLVLAKYEFKWAFLVAMLGTSSIDPQNWKLLVSSNCCENGEIKTRTYLRYFVWVVSDIL